jgi:hypothetical protein
MSEPVYAKRLSDSVAMSDDDLEQEHDRLLELGDTIVSEDYYRDELARRQAQRATDKMVSLTWAVAAMTVANLGFVAYSALH